MAKKVIALLGALVVIAGVGVTSNAQNGSFHLRMIEQAPSNVQQYKDTAYFESKRNGCVNFNVTTYRSEYAGGYAVGSAQANSNGKFQTNQVTMQDRGLYRSYYKGDSIPQYGIRMKATVRLKNYSGRKVVMIDGNVGEE